MGYLCDIKFLHRWYMFLDDAFFDKASDDGAFSHSGISEYSYSIFSAVVSLFAKSRKHFVLQAINTRLFVCDSVIVADYRDQTLRAEFERSRSFAATVTFLQLITAKNCFLRSGKENTLRWDTVQMNKRTSH